MMKKNLKLVVFLSLMFISFISILAYEYSYASITTNDYEALKITKPEKMQADEFKEIVINDLPTDTNLVIKERKIDGVKDSYEIYTKESMSFPENFEIFNQVKFLNIQNINSSSINNNQIFVEHYGYLEYTENLKKDGITVKDLGINQTSIFVTKDILVLIILIMILNLIILGYFVIRNFKKISLLKLEGKSNNQILYLEFLEIIKFILKYVVILILFIVIIQLIFNDSINIQMLHNVFKNYVIYFIFLSLSFLLCNKLLFKNEYIIYIKDGVKYNYNILLVFKMIFLFLIVFSSTTLIANILKIGDLKQEINKYSEYSDYVVSSTYLPYQGSEGEGKDFDTAIYDYYKLTNEKFKGLIYDVNKQAKEISVNNNMLNNMKIKTTAGKDIKFERYSKTKITYFVPISKKNDDRYQNSDYYDVVYMPNGYEFIGTNLEELNFENKVKDYTIIYYPDEVSDPGDKLNFSAILTRSGYFLKTNSDDPYETLKPYIEKAEASNYIISTPNITVEKEKQLFQKKENLIYSFFKLILGAFGFFIAMLLYIKAYISAHIKDIVIKELEGKRDYLKKLIIYNCFIYGILIFLNFLLKMNGLEMILILFIVDNIVLIFQSQKQIKTNRIFILKGDKWF